MGMENFKQIVETSQHIHCSYENSGHVYADVNIFTTIPGQQSISPILSNYTKKSIANLEPPLPYSLQSGSILAKTNGGMFVVATGRALGFYYFSGESTVYVDGAAFSSINSIPDGPSGSEMFATQYYPSFCVKHDGSAAIRWFNDSAALADAVPYCKYIFAAAHPLVYTGKNIFTNTMTADGKIIYDKNNPNSKDDRFNSTFGNVGSGSKRALIGHKPDGAFVLVSVLSETMPLIVAANMLVELGCDYGVHLDGSTPVQMKIKAGYGPTALIGSGMLVSTAICAYTVSNKYDVNGDGVLNQQDVQIVQSQLGQLSSSSALAAKCDFNHDGIVDMIDLTIIMAAVDAQG